VEKDVIKLLKLAGIATTADRLERPPLPELGDFAFPCFELAKLQKKNPALIAQETVARLKGKFPKGAVKDVRAAGPYVNFFLDWSKLSGGIVKSIVTKADKYGKPARVKKERIMVEFSQPNPVHSMHIGHARGTFLGAGLSNLFEFMGHKVIRANYMNDCGLQVAKLVTAYQLWAENKTPEEKPDVWLWKYYVKFHELAEADPTLDERARENLRLIDVVKDKTATALRDRIVRWCVDGFEQTYKNAGIRFDTYLYESRFRDRGKKVVMAALKKGYAFESPEKTIVALTPERDGLPGFVVLRSDGTGLYQTSDLGATIYKFEHYKLDRALWVVANAQNLYFKQVKRLFELLGYKWERNAIHFAFDLVRLPEGTMSSRKGKAVLLDDVLAKLTDMAYDEVNKRSPNEKEDSKRKTAHAIGVGALKYAIEKIEPDKGITFNFQAMLNFEGNTGPYLQYAHTRCASVLRKAKEAKVKPRAAKVKWLAAEEQALVKALADFPFVVQQAAKDMRVSYICNYAFDVATKFSSFYNACPVLKADMKETREFRLALVVATKTVLANALRILGMEPIERM
jgi:arginyl-tRNA synthetase